MRTPLPPFQYTEARLAVYSQARAIVESVSSPGTAAPVMARPGTLCIATVTVLVILVAAVQTGAVAYLEGVPSSMGSIEPPLLKGCLRKYYAQTCALIVVPPFTSSILGLGMAICYIRPLQYNSLFLITTVRIRSRMRAGGQYPITRYSNLYTSKQHFLHCI